MSGEPIIALVTGGNKGIGFAIVRALCKHFQEKGVVYLTARNEELGHEAVKNLNAEKLHPEFLQLDITDVSSIQKARDFLVKKHGGLDILVNNAGIAFKVDAKEPFGTQAETTVAANFTGTLNVCEELFPILRPHARVVNVSSKAGNLNYITNTTIRQRLTSLDLTLEELKKIMADFVSAAQRGTHQDVGFPSTAYGMSKIGVTALTQVQQRMLDNDTSKSDIVVNACCPGYVSTDMSSHKGVKTIDEGADTPTYLALLPSAGTGDATSTKGAFVSDREVVDFAKGW